MSDDWCPRQIVFMLPGVPGVQVTATEIEIDGTIEFVIDVLDSKLSTGDLRALFFHINEDEFPGLTVTSDSPYLTERRIGANAILDLDDGATLAGKVKTGFDVGIEWGTAGGKKDDINFPVSFTLSNTTGDLTLDDLGGLLFGAKLDSVGGQGGPRGSSSKLIAFAPFAPDAVNDVYKIHHEDGVPDANTPSKNPQELVLNVLANDSDQDTPKDQLVITGIHEGPSHGTAAIGPDGKTILYTPDLDYSGPDSFEYCVSDGNGGQDHALVTLELAAVADVPIIDVEVISGASVYEFTLKVTAKENDADSSEFIDRIDAAVAGGLPAGVSIAPLGGFNPGDEPNEVVKEFKVTLPQNQDIDFDLNFTAVSEETSNGDQEVVSKAIAIEVDYNQNFFNASFFADNRDIWGPGEPFSFHEQEFIGIDDVFDPPQIDIPIPPTPLLFFGDAKIDAQVGFDFEVKITGGEFDATIPIDVQVDTVYNKTTDQFLVNPTFDISDSGAKIDGTGPGGFLSILPIFDVTADFEAGLDLVVTELEFLSVHERINPDLSDLGLTLDTGDAKVTIPLFPGFSLGLDFPELNPDAGPSTANPLVAHDASDNFVEINLDVDQFAANYFPPIAALSVEIPFFAGIPVVAEVSGNVVPFDADVTGGLNLLQDLSMHVGLNGTLTFENGSNQTFKFGEAFTIDHALSKDINGDEKIDFTLSITPDVDLTNNTDININVNLSLELFRISGTFSPIVGEDSTFDEAVVDFEEKFDIASFPVFDKTFDVLLGSQDLGLIVV